MSLGRIMTQTTLEIWRLKVHGSKDSEKKVADFATKVSANKFLKRAREKKKREEKKKEEKKEALVNLKGEGRVSADMKLAYHMVKWVEKGDGNLSQTEFNVKYFETAIDLKVASSRKNKTSLSCSLVRGKII